MLGLLLMFKFFFFAPSPKNDVPKSIYDFKVQSITGDTIDFAAFKGKKILIVNTASECGFTPQYKELEELYEKYKDKLVIIGFPANNFLKQEPGDNKEIAAFCEKNFHVTFPMAAKISVKGKDIAPIYQWLTDKHCNGVMNSSVKWNFQKYLVNEKGELVDVYYSMTKPLSSKIEAAINK